MGAQDHGGGSATHTAAHARGQPRDALSGCLLSERTAWAVQNAVGAVFTALFAVVVDLQFTLACLCAVMYSASSLVLSPDRSVGGRMFGGVIFIGTVLSGACVGGGLVSLAWLARGSGAKSLVDYLPASLQAIPDRPTIERLKELLAQLTSVPLPPLLRELLDRAVDWVSEQLYQVIPPVSSAFWALLMVLAAVSFLPLAAARADRDMGKGVIIAIVFVFLSSMLVFGSLMPALGEQLFWEEVVVGYIKVALVAAGGNVAAGLLVYVRSANDDVRRSCAALFRGTGIRISRLGTAASGAAVIHRGGAAASASASAPASASAATQQGWSQGQSQSQGGLEAGQPAAASAAAERYLQDMQSYVARRVAVCSEEAAASWARAEAEAARAGGEEEGQGAPPLSEAAEAGLAPLPAGASEADFELAWASLAISMKTVRLEPPLPLLCSQPGASPAKYAELQKQLARLQRAVTVLGRGQAGCLQALAGTEGTAGQVAGRLRATLARISGLSAAACAGAASALAHMPALQACAGAALSWRPLPAADWAGAHAELAEEARQLAERYHTEFEGQGLEFALSLGVQEHRALLYVLAAAAEVMDSAQAAEAAAAHALQVPLPAEQDPPLVEQGPPLEGAKAAAAQGGASPDSPTVDVEAGKMSRTCSAEEAGAGKGQPARQQPAAGQNAPPAPLLHRLAANPYLSGFATLLLLCTPLPALKLVVDACVRMARALPGLLFSRKARLAALRDPMVQFGSKYWLAMTACCIAITAIMWKAIPKGEGPLQDAYQQVDFFLTWQPIYASITVAICLQDTVEASLFRGILRSTMTVLGGTLGYLVMLNGSLANNAYWVVAWVAGFSALAGLLAPDRTLRYSLFLFVFTANAVVTCQYIGCCDVAGDPKVYAGKIVSTVIGSTLAILFGWLVLPLYGSTRMLGEQAGALRAALAVQRRMLKGVAAAAGESRAVCTDGWLEAIEQDVQAPLARVGADMELNQLDRRQMPLTWHLLPDPAVLRLLQHALCPLRDRLASAALVLRRDLFSGSPAASKQAPPAAGAPYTAAAGPAVVPGPVFRRVIAELGEDAEQLMESLEGLVAACSENMTASAAGSGLKPQRDAVAEALAATQAARLQLHQKYLQAQPAALQAAGGHTGGDFACQAWLHAMFRSADEMVVAASLLLQEAAQDRDVLMGWLRAWRGQRAAPS